MTVCIAALFKWNIAPAGSGSPQHETAALVFTDRMITAGDIQYEPQQTKIAHITPTALLVIAGDYSLHSQAIKSTGEHFQNSPTASPESIATFYGRRVQAIKLKEAEDIFLAPLGLNSDSFLAQQKDMAPHFVSLLTEQMQGYQGDQVDALIVGSGGDFVQIYGVDSKGRVRCYDDVGFAAIGIGAPHAQTVFMQAGYTNTVILPRAASIGFVAKKAAEIAPGVGPNTDITIVFKSHKEPLRLDVAAKLNDLYLEYVPKRNALGDEFIARFTDYITKPTLQVANEEPKGIPGGDAQTDERPSPPAAETPRKNENRAKASGLG